MSLHKTIKPSVLGSIVALGVISPGTALSTTLEYSPYVVDYSQFSFPTKGNIGDSALAQSSDTDFERIGELDVSFIDEPGEGIYDDTPFTEPDGSTTTVGAYRLSIIHNVITHFSTQFNFGGVNPKVEIDFAETPGFLAVTFGPSFSTATSVDSYGVMEEGRFYPVTLEDSLKRQEFISISATITFGSGVSALELPDAKPMPQLAYSLYHELTHFLGFSSIDCPAQICAPEPKTRKDHLSKYFVVANPDGIDAYDDLPMEARENALRSEDRLWFSGSENTRSAMRDELTAGHDEGRIFMHATPQRAGKYAGEVDPQAGSHISTAVYPYPLMASYGGMTEDLGAAAFIMCDIGWCRNQGKVVDLASAIQYGYTTESGTVVLDVTFSNLSNVVVDEFDAWVTFNSTDVLGIVEGGDYCELTEQQLVCSSNFIPLDEKIISLEVTAEEAFDLEAGIRVSAFDVDRSGFNNLSKIEENTAPIISCFAGETAEDVAVCEVEIATTGPQSMDFYVDVINLDGDELTYNWSASDSNKYGFTTQGEFGEDLVIEFPEETDRRWETMSFNLEVTDGELSDSMDLIVFNSSYEENEAPVIVCSTNTIPCEMTLSGVGEMTFSNYEVFDNNSHDTLEYSWEKKEGNFPFSTSNDDRDLTIEFPDEVDTSWEKVVFTLTVDDGLASATLDFEYVNADYKLPVNTPPEIVCDDDCVYDLSATGDVELEGFSVSDDAPESLSYNWSGGENAFPFQATGGSIIISFPESVDSSWESVSYTLSVSDGDFTSSQTFVLNNADYVDNSSGDDTASPAPSPEASSSGGGSLGWLVLLLVPVMVVRARR